MTNIKHTLLCIAIMACPALANAEQTVINLTQAGTLSSIITTDDKKSETTELKITGELNGDDIFLIRDLGDLYNLESLDISEAKIVSGGQAYFTLDEEHFTADNEIGDYMFYSLEKLKSIKLPKSATKIGNHALQDCQFLQAVELPASLTSIGKEAFMSCYAITEIEFPATLETIGDAAFAYCELTTVTLPASVTKIGDNCFYPRNISLYLKGTVPPEPGAYMMGYDAKVYVPKGSIDAYRTTGWDVYDLYEYEPTGIQSAVIDNADGTTTYYTLDGKKTDTPQEGIYIIRQEDGTAKKVVF